MPHIDVSVDIELDEFDTDDLLDELCFRIKSTTPRQSRRFTPEHTAKLYRALGGSPSNELSLIDQMKLETFMNNIDRIDLTQLENLVK